MARELGLIYQWATLFTMGFLAWLALGRHGTRVLGRAPEPEYGDASWMAMLFCAGIGGGLMYWSSIEWAFYVDQPPFGVEPGGAKAREWAATYGIFHWGPAAWALYALPTVAIAWPYYRYELPCLRLSGALTGLFGRGFPDRPAGRAVDFFFIIALIGGTGTSLGLTTPMLGAVAARLFGVDESLGLTWAITGGCAALFGASAYLGLDRGIRRLSNANLVVGAVFLAWVLAVGPARFALELGTSSIGLMLQEFVRMNTWTEPLADTGFVEDWTVFYWAWWIAYGPFMGLFVTRISRGRTLRALVLGMARLRHPGLRRVLHRVGQQRPVARPARGGSASSTSSAPARRPPPSPPPSAPWPDSRGRCCCSWCSASSSWPPPTTPPRTRSRRRRPATSGPAAIRTASTACSGRGRSRSCPRPSS